MGLKTPLYDLHCAAGAKIVDFGGWDMPLHYGSQVNEHHAVRQAAGMFDVSHMNVVDIRGEGAKDFLRRLLANDVARLKTPGKALYTCMLNESGGVIDDLIVYRMSDSHYRVVMNAATRDKDLAWLAEVVPAHGDVAIDEQSDTAMLAVQGPEARKLVASALPAELGAAALDLKPFSALAADTLFVARTGYTGEDGFEVVLPAGEVASLWNSLVEAGVQPAGLGARDTLRLEAGMHLYGSDLDDATTPLECGLDWTVSFEAADRHFIGREALEAMRGNPDRRRFVGLLLKDRGVLRDHQRVVLEDGGEGEITSGGFSPTLGRSIAMARLPAGDQTTAKVEVRNRLLDVDIVALPFVRNGEAKVKI